MMLNEDGEKVRCVYCLRDATTEEPEARCEDCHDELERAAKCDRGSEGPEYDKYEHIPWAEGGDR
jgi:predicted amidophosphoribosyltransferase